MKNRKKIIEIVIVTLLVLGGLIPLIVVFVDEKSACTLSVDETLEELRINAGFYGDFTISIEDATISFVEDTVEVVEGREVYVKNNRNSFAGITGITTYPDFPVYLGIRNKSLSYILLIVGENYYLVNEKTLDATNALYTLLLQLQST